MSGDKITVEAGSEDRTDVQAARAAPISLPAGSYDAEALNTALSDAAKAKNDGTREDDVNAALEKHNETAIPTNTLGVPPGYKRVDAEVKDLGVTESRVVYDPSQQEAAEAAQAGAPVNIKPGAVDAPSPATKGE